MSSRQLSDTGPSSLQTQPLRGSRNHLRPVLLRSRLSTLAVRPGNTSVLWSATLVARCDGFIFSACRSKLAKDDKSRSPQHWGLVCGGSVGRAELFAIGHLVGHAVGHSQHTDIAPAGRLCSHAQHTDIAPAGRLCGHSQHTDIGACRGLCGHSHNKSLPYAYASYKVPVKSSLLTCIFVYRCPTCSRLALLYSLTVQSRTDYVNLAAVTLRQQQRSSDATLRCSMLYCYYERM